ncbi:uncharacterized protein ColSpa_01926 [Colletotrichum spaethianum]|uniref:Uncharacterized protein n=1 Tax=Colletotrichum spaethianum TaxID=700344 RepID=A0AA37L7U5_9PEZI|nr:uncharacterized protein ColSpa_01926 [Colletotrichum spaethianum]GKT41745.1 hypothetical protein ColSpa_01926 [Colletotrichum spaethianum]
MEKVMLLWHQAYSHASKLQTPENIVVAHSIQHRLPPFSPDKPLYPLVPQDLAPLASRDDAPLHVRAADVKWKPQPPAFIDLSSSFPPPSTATPTTIPWNPDPLLPDVPPLEPAPLPVEREVPPPLVHAADAVLRAFVRVRAPDVLVLELPDLLLHRRQLSLPFLLIVLAAIPLSKRVGYHVPSPSSPDDPSEPVSTTSRFLVFACPPPLLRLTGLPIALALFRLPSASSPFVNLKFNTYLSGSLLPNNLTRIFLSPNALSNFSCSSQTTKLPVPALPVSTTWFHRQCTLVSVAFRFSRPEFGSPGSPYITAQLTLLPEVVVHARDRVVVLVHHKVRAAPGPGVREEEAPQGGVRREARCAGG